MLALTVEPGTPNSLTLENTAEPSDADGALLIRTIALGVCGTDRDIISGAYGAAPPGQHRLVLGHESLGVVVDAPQGSGFKAGELVVGIVRRPDPVPCPACASGEWDMCRNGLYTERGIKQRAGYGSERFRLEPEFAVRIPPSLGNLGVLVEPTSVVAKAWDHIERIGKRTPSWRPHRVMVTGAGPIGLLAALLGVQRGYAVTVMDRNTGGPKPELVRALGCQYLTAVPDGLEPDIVLECTGAEEVIVRAIETVAPDGLVCLAGVSDTGHCVRIDLGKINKMMVLENNVLFGSVNANRRHYEQAVSALTAADQSWLRRLITRRVPLSRWAEAFDGRAGDIKVVVDFGDAQHAAEA
jgi:threonine dehydrogenase-like Zn-dependent dehydrogenase